MSSISHDHPVAWWTAVEMWAALAITAMWTAVAVTAIAGPYIYSNDGTRCPAAVAIALFATIGTWAVARHGLRRRD